MTALRTALISLLGLALTPTLSFAAPQSSPTTTPFYYQPVTATFYGAAASYELSFPADGSTYETNNNLSISLISISGIYNPYYGCNYYTDGMKAIVPSSEPNGTLSLGPPQPVYAIACEATPGGDSTCLPIYSSCEWNSQQGGSYELECCSGYCAATLCRPT